MGQFNPSSPTRRGMEWVPGLARGITLAGASRQAIAGRFQADDSLAISHLHPYLLDVVGRAGLHLEIIDDVDEVALNPQVDYLPGTDTGATTTGWLKSSGAAAFYTYLATLSGTQPAIFLVNTAAMATSSLLKLKFRASATPLPASVRVVRVELWAFVGYNPTTSQSPSANVYGLLDLAGIEYTVGSVAVPRDGRWSMRRVADVSLNPATKLPWTATQINNLLNATTDEFGMQVGPGARIIAQGFGFGGIALRVVTCAENRYGYLHMPDTPTKGISRQTLVSTKALKIGDWYRWVLAPLSGEPGSKIVTSALSAPKARIAQTPADVGEHRQLYEVTLSGAGGVPIASSPRPGEIAPMLLEDSGGITDESNPYAKLIPFTQANLIGGLDLDGTAGGYATVPDATKLRLSTAGAFATWVAPDDWTPAADTVLLSKSGGAGNRGYELWLLTTGVVRLRVSEDGTAQTNYDSTANLSPLGDGTGKAIKATFAANSATGVNFYTSDDMVTWTQLGAAVSTSGFTDIHPSTAQVEIGAVNAGTSRLNGRVYYAGIYGDVAAIDPRMQAAFTVDPAYSASVTARPGQTSIVAKTGGTVTLLGTARLVQRTLAQEWTSASGTNAYRQIVLAVGWAAGVEPDAPLIVEFRSGATAYQGAGTLEGIALLTPAQYRAQGGVGPPREVLIEFRDSDGSSTWTPTASTKYVVTWRSAASAGRGWLVMVADTLSTDAATVKTTTTQANIEGASHQGTTDRAVINGTPSARYDLPLHLVLAPAAPTATAVAKAGT